MNIEEFLGGFETLAEFGVSLSTEKRLVLYYSLILLKNDAHFKELYLWGIVRGYTADYYVAFGYEKDALRGRIFYYSTNGIDWFVLPEPKQSDFIYASKCFSKFQGDPSFAAQIDMDRMSSDDLLKLRAGKEMTDSEMGEEMIEEELTTEQEVDAIKEEGKLKEEDRLAAIVHLINEEAMVMPRGALYKRVDGSVVNNQAFEGLELLEADEMRSYLHYRIPHQTWNTNLLTRTDYNYGVDFLDAIDSDRPAGFWAMKLGNGSKIAFLQNLLWPGYVFYHSVGFPKFASFYFGDGKKNVDIPFML